MFYIKMKIYQCMHNNLNLISLSLRIQKKMPLKTIFMKRIFFGLFLSILLFSNSLKAQDDINAITTAVSFLLIAPDSRASGMGDAGVSTSPDVNAQFWNPAKYPFIETDFGVGVNYSPWLRKLVNDMNLSYLSGYTKLNKNSAISASLKYFTMGEIEFTDDQGNSKGKWKPNEFAIDGTYSRKLGKNFAAAVSLRYIYSNLTLGQSVGGQSTQAGQSIATDISTFYNRKFKYSGYEGVFSFGAVISNLGNKISYSETLERDFIPTNLRLGPSLFINLDKYNSLLLTVDLNKLLVPTPPVYAKDSNNNTLVDNEGNYVIESGMDPNRSPVNALFTSFYDAPYGYKEELHEISYSAGLEYIYDKMFFLRGGYFYEHKYKGNRQFATLGVGFKFNVFTLDVSYLIPMNQQNPLENTLRFSLLFNFDNASKTQGI